MTLLSWHMTLLSWHMTLLSWDFFHGSCDSGLSVHGLAYARKLADFVDSHIVRDPPNPHSHAPTTTTNNNSDKNASNTTATATATTTTNNSSNTDNSKKLLCSSIHTGGPSTSSSTSSEQNKTLTLLPYLDLPLTCLPYPILTCPHLLTLS